VYDLRVLHDLSPPIGVSRCFPVCSSCAFLPGQAWACRADGGGTGPPPWSQPGFECPITLGLPFPRHLRAFFLVRSPFLKVWPRVMTLVPPLSAVGPLILTLECDISILSSGSCDSQMLSRKQLLVLACGFVPPPSPVQRQRSFLFPSLIPNQESYADYLRAAMIIVA